MRYWRMAMRDGDHGADMFEQCRLRSIAAITYNNLVDIDLTPYSRKHLPEQWKRQKQFSPGSMAAFAFDILGGDILFVKDSLSQRIIGCGSVNEAVGTRAYRFEEDNPVRTPSGYPWRHYINITWLDNFKPVAHIARAPIITVLALNEDEIAALGKGIVVTPATTVMPMKDVADSLRELLLGQSYSRTTSSKSTEIVPLHRFLSHRFCAWLKSKGASQIAQEAMGIDVSFCHKGVQAMAELKIAYGGNTSAAIREALGQVFEYNLRQGRSPRQKWLLVLNSPPFKEDIDFVRSIRNSFRVPLFLGWETKDKTFTFESDWSA